MAPSCQSVALCAAVLLVAASFPGAYALNCYQCNSFEDPACADITQGNSTYAHLLRPCDGDYSGQQPFCRKMVQTLQRNVPVVRVRRTCSWERSRNPCYMFDDGDHIEKVCQCFEDGCNSAATPVSLGLLALLGIFTATSVFLSPH